MKPCANVILKYLPTIRSAVAGKPLLLFDMDGTIIIPREEAVESKVSIHSLSVQSRSQMKSVACSHGIPLTEIDSLNRMAHIWNKARSYAEANGFNEMRVIAMMAALNECFNRQEALEHSLSTLVQGAVEVLKDLMGDSYLLGMVTSASRAGYERASHREEFGCFGRFFTYSITRDDCRYVKPDPEPINRILRLFNRSDFIYIGDSDHDAEAAKAAGGSFILLNTRMYGQNMVQSMDPSGIIDRFIDLPDLISHILKSTDA